MGFGGINIWSLLLILAIVVLLFGTKKLTGIGSDLGGAIKGFKKAMDDSEGKEKDDEQETKSVESMKSESLSDEEKKSSAEKQP